MLRSDFQSMHAVDEIGEGAHLLAYLRSLTLKRLHFVKALCRRLPQRFLPHAHRRFPSTVLILPVNRSRSVEPPRPRHDLTRGYHRRSRLNRMTM